MKEIELEKRLNDLESYSILDTLPESDYDNLTAIASEICKTPISLISLLDDKRQWFKSRHGIDASETPIDQAFCAHAIKQINDPFIIPDARLDDRFKNNPLVTGQPNIVFYAGIPLISDNGNALGTLCVIDTKPKELSKSQLNSLAALASQVMSLFQLRKNNLNKELYLRKLQEFQDSATEKVLESTKNINSLAKILERTNVTLDERALTIIDMLQESSEELKTMIHDLKESK